MFTTKQYRDKATEYNELVKSAASPNERRKYLDLEKSFTVLADNEQWLADNHEHTLHAQETSPSDGATLAKEEERILRCLGAALIMQWNTLPQKIQRELFDNAGSVGALPDTATLRGQIARFLHKHMNDGETEGQ